MTTRIDFYILPDVDPDARRRFACRLAYKAVAAGRPVHVHTEGSEESHELDELMWAYPSHQFLPHGRMEAPEAALAPVTIGHDAPQPPEEAVLINLSATIPPFFTQFERLAEIVVEEQRKQLREHYRYYRARGYALYHHRMDDWEEQ